MLAALTLPGHNQWRRTKGVPVGLYISDLTRKAKALAYFVFSRLIPSNHHTEVNMDRCILTYLLLTRQPIDLGFVLNYNIKRVARNKTTGNLPHPHIITELCGRAGVKWEASEANQRPRTFFSYKRIRRMGGGEEQIENNLEEEDHLPIQEDMNHLLDQATMQPQHTLDDVYRLLVDLDHKIDNSN